MAKHKSILDHFEKLFSPFGPFLSGSSTLFLYHKKGSTVRDVWQRHQLMQLMINLKYLDYCSVRHFYLTFCHSKLKCWVNFGGSFIFNQSKWKGALTKWEQYLSIIDIRVGWFGKLEISHHFVVCRYKHFCILFLHGTFLNVLVIILISVKRCYTKFFLAVGY